MDKNTSKVLEPAGDSLLSGNGAGSRLFVINLCASMAPVQIPGKALPGLESYRLYQVARMEDGRTRHRLRLGFFSDENEAGMVLASVRNQYPTAFTTCLADEDHRFARGYTPAAAGARVAAGKPVAVVAASASASAAPKAAPRTAAKERPAAATVGKPQAAIATAQPVASTKPAPEAHPIELTWEPETAAAKPAAPARSKAAAPAQSNAAAGTQSKTTAPAHRAPLQAAEIELSWESPTQAPAKPSAAEAQAKRDEVRLSTNTSTIELTLEAEPARATPPQRAAAATTQSAPAQPFHVGKGADIPDVKINFVDASSKATAAAGMSATNAKAPLPTRTSTTAKNEPAQAKPTPPVRVESPEPKAPVAAKPAPPIAQKPAAPPAPPAAPAAMRPAVSATPHGLDMQLPELDSTQTIRALTSTELSDDSQEKWFAIQLAVSDQPVNLDAMPRLDIFEAYRLYSVATAGSGKIVHSLRLGFFREAVSAEAVSGYLKTFFGTPTVMRISVAEQLRFKDPPVRKGPAPGAKAESNVVALNARERSAPVVPTVTVEVTPKLDTGATGSFKPNNTGSFNAHATGKFKAQDTGKFRAQDTGKFRAQNTGSFKAADTGSFKANATGSHRALPNAAKSAVATRSASVNKMSSTGKFKATRKPSLQEALLQEAREVELSESGIRKLPKSNSLLARLVGKLTK